MILVWWAYIININLTTVGYHWSSNLWWCKCFFDNNKVRNRGTGLGYEVLCLRNSYGNKTTSMHFTPKLLIKMWDQLIVSFFIMMFVVCATTKYRVSKSPIPRNLMKTVLLVDRLFRHFTLNCGCNMVIDNPDNEVLIWQQCQHWAQLCHVTSSKGDSFCYLSLFPEGMDALNKWPLMFTESSVSAIVDTPILFCYVLNTSVLDDTRILNPI